MKMVAGALVVLGGAIAFAGAVIADAIHNSPTTEVGMTVAAVLVLVGFFVLRVGYLEAKDKA